MVNLKTLKGFNNEGVYAKRGSTIQASELRAQQLERNGLVERLHEKVAAEPENKAKQKPENKSKAEK